MLFRNVDQRVLRLKNYEMFIRVYIDLDTFRNIIMIVTRPNISQFWSLKIRRTTFQNYIKFANLLISKLKICEVFGQEVGIRLQGWHCVENILLQSSH